MNRMEFDSFVAETGFNCNIGGDEKWQGTKVESLVTRKVQQMSPSRSRTGRCAVDSVNSCTKAKDSAEGIATCKEVR